MSAPSQALLKRRQGTTKEDFKKYYIEHHGQLVLPYFLDRGVLYYAQIHNIHWTSPEAEQKNAGIDLSAWDAVAEAVFAAEAVPDAVEDDGLANQYRKDVILHDEQRFLFDEALNHMKVLEPGSVSGERVEFIVDGRAVLSEKEWSWARQEWDACRKKMHGSE